MKSWMLVFCLGSVLNLIIIIYSLKDARYWLGRKQNSAGLMFLQMSKKNTEFTNKTQMLSTHAICFNTSVASIDKGCFTVIIINII